MKFYWPAFVRLKQDELVSGWLVRLAYAHNLDILSFDEMCPQLKLRHIDLDSDSYIIEKLTANAVMSSFLINNALFGIYDTIFAKWLLPVESINRATNRYGLMVCPNCLKNDGADPYYRKLWRMGFAFVCLECQCYLIDRCPSCQAPLSVFNHKVMTKSTGMVLPLNLCFSCRFDLRKSVLVYPKSYWIDLQYKINYIVDSTTFSCSSVYSGSDLHALCNVFGSRHMASEELAMAIADELNMPRISRNWKDLKGFANMGIEKRKYYLMISDWLLNDFLSKIQFIASHYKIHVEEEVLQVHRNRQSEFHVPECLPILRQ